MTAATPASPDLRDCKLYRFYGWDPRTGYTTKTLIYIGETVREPFDRMMEHIARQPWADTITSWEQDDRAFAGKDAVLRAEQAAVEAERPLYNDEWNRGNSDRIELEEAKQQRWSRDDARGVPRWRPTSKRTMYRRGEEVAAPADPKLRARRVSSRPASRSPGKGGSARPGIQGSVAASVVLTLACWLLLDRAGALTGSTFAGAPVLGVSAALWLRGWLRDRSR